MKWEKGTQDDISTRDLTYFSHSFPINKLDKVGQLDLADLDFSA